VQASTPPQSPVWHDPLPVLSNEQPVRGHTRPGPVPAGMLRVQYSPGSSFTPPPGTAAGHMVSEHLLLMLNVMALPTGRSRKRCRRWRVQEELRDVILCFGFLALAYLLGCILGCTMVVGLGPCGRGAKRKIKGGMGNRYSKDCVLNWSAAYSQTRNTLET